MKELTYFDKIEEKGKKYTILNVSAYALSPEEHREAISELEEEGVPITKIDSDSVRGTLKGRYDAIKKTIANLETKEWFDAKGWFWDEEEKNECESEK